ncbi:MAG: glycosyltransferase family 4 protein [Betaproteobacteria bacterium]
MRIVVHDYAGHPFQVQLSRALAERGHDVLHLYSASLQTPRGELTVNCSDPATLAINPIQLSRVIPKSNFFKRYQLESEYAKKLVAVCREFKPDVVLSANSPSVVQFRLARWCQATGTRLVSWIQDMYGVAAYRILKKKLPGLGHLIGRHFMSLDRRSARWSDEIVVITEDFEPVFERMGIPRTRLHTIHNWAPIDDLPVGPRETKWSAEVGLGSGLRFVYSGTLAMKHNPGLLLQLAKQCDQWGNAELIVISEGAGIEWLQEEACKIGVKSLRCLGFQPFEMMDQVFASADVLLAILEPDAGAFCVPSKVLSYMCARRALLAAIPADNLAARIIADENAGLVVDPDDANAFVKAAQQLFEDPLLREKCGQAARGYAERNFLIDTIADRFCEILGAPSTAPVNL